MHARAQEEHALPCGDLLGNIIQHYKSVTTRSV